MDGTEQTQSNADSAPRWHVWKHICANHAQDLSWTCTASEDPWQVDAPDGWIGGGTFATHAEAIASVRP